MSSRSETGVAVVEEFFAQQRKRDVVGMAELCSPRAKFDYVPFVSHDKQRVVTGKGYVNGVGRTIWALGFRAFPDLTNKVHEVFADEDGNVVAEVTRHRAPRRAPTSRSRRAARSTPSGTCSACTSTRTGRSTTLRRTGTRPASTPNSVTSSWTERDCRHV